MIFLKAEAIRRLMASEKKAQSSLNDTVQKSQPVLPLNAWQTLENAGK